MHHTLGFFEFKLAGRSLIVCAINILFMVIDTPKVTTLFIFWFNGRSIFESVYVSIKIKFLFLRNKKKEQICLTIRPRINDNNVITF